MLEPKEYNPLVIHAERELKLAGLFDKDSDYNGALGREVLNLVKVFSKQGHSGASAFRTIELFRIVASYKNLMPIGTTKDEWVDISEDVGRPCWQNKRNSAMFSETAGENWYDVKNKEKIFKKV